MRSMPVLNGCHISKKTMPSEYTVLEGPRQLGAQARGGERTSENALSILLLYLTARSSLPRCIISGAM